MLKKIMITWMFSIMGFPIACGPAEPTTSEERRLTLEDYGTDPLGDADAISKRNSGSPYTKDSKEAIDEASEIEVYDETTGMIIVKRIDEETKTEIDESGATPGGATDTSNENQETETTLEEDKLALGTELYKKYCASCHMPLEETPKRDRSAENILFAIENIMLMNHLDFLSTDQLGLISLALSTKTQPAPSMEQDPTEDPKPTENPSPIEAPKPIEEPKDPIEETPSPSDEELALRAKGVRLYEQHCQKCHLNIENSTKKDRNVASIDSAITNIKIMQSLSFLAGEDINAIAIALSPIVEETPPDSEQNLKLVFGAPLPTTRLMSSKLNALFNQDTNANRNSNQRNSINTQINNLVTTKYAFFGGHCNHLEFNEDRRTCPGGANHMKNAFLGVSNVVRSGYQYKFCTELLHRDRAIFSVLDFAGINRNTARSNPNIALLASAMLSGLTIKTPQIDALKKVADTAKNNNLNSLDEWKFIAMAICRSSMFDAN